MKPTKKMKTTKKQIRETLRTLDRTKIFKLHYKLYGNVSRTSIYDFIKEYAPTNRVSNEAYNIAYVSQHHGSSYHDTTYIGKHGYFVPLKYQAIVDFAKSNIRDYSNYQKVPMVYNGMLIFASPTYKCADYNKWHALKIKGNEKFVETLIKYFNNNNK